MNNHEITCLATGEKTIQTVASASEALFSSCDRCQQMSGSEAGTRATRLQTSWPLIPGHHRACQFQDASSMSRHRLPCARDQGLPWQDAACSCAQTSQDSYPGPVVTRPVTTGGGGSWATESLSFSRLTTLSHWLIIVRNLRIVGKSNIYENKRKV